MADTFDDETDALTDSERLATGDFRALVSGARILNGIAIAALLVAIAALVFNFWTYWDFANQGGDDAQRFHQAIASALQASWGWALVAVLAFLGSLLLRGQLARLWLDSEGDDEA